MVRVVLEDRVEVESLKHDERMARQMCDQLVSVGRLQATDDADVLVPTLLVFDCGHALLAALPGLKCTILGTALLVPR